MPTAVEVDTFSDAGLKKFDLKNVTSKPLSAPVDVAAEMGLKFSTPSEESGQRSYTLDDFEEIVGKSRGKDEEKEDEEESPEKTLEQKKSDEHGKKIVDNFSKLIQERSEELYEMMSYRAKNEEGFLDRLAESNDKTERKMAEKILQRNPSLGAKTVDEYKIKRAKEKVGDDPTKQAIAELKARQDSFDAKQKENAWLSWKKENAVAGEAAILADAYHEQHPDLSWGIIMDAVKGRMGVSEFSSKASGSAATGNSSVPMEGELTVQSQFGRNVLAKLDLKKIQKFAKEYYR